jgi:carbon starvation protein CstA
MITFCVALACLVLGYFLYGMFVEKVFGVDPNRKTPCYTRPDGSDYIPMPTWKVYTVQFLNIAGTGPIFGAMMGVLYGPAAFFWIVLGCILGGAMHDYMAGMISIRRNGMGLPEIIGDELGSVCRLVMRVVTLVLMICVGASFVLIPAGLMDQLTLRLFDVANTNLIWTVAILVFYLAVTVFSINKVIGTVYPVFGAALLIMAVLIGVGIFTHDGNFPSITEAFTDHYPVPYTPLFPGLFITIACGAVSGFHATQSPMMARCIKNEKYGLRCFYGAMVTEGVVALIWAAAALKFVDMMDIAGATPYEKLYNAMTACGTVKMNPGLLVERMCNDWLGNAGLVLAVLGIVAAPMSTGGSAFRAARMIVADFSHYDQKPLTKRLLLTAPLFAVAIVMLNVSSFKVLWLYVSWFNQVLATFTFFTITHYLHHRNDGKGILPRWSWIISFLPAVFMLSVSSEFILVDKENGFGLPVATSQAIAALITTVFTVLFVIYDNKEEKH